jgi:hypothetical protein
VPPRERLRRARHNLVWAALISVLVQAVAPGWAVSVMAARALDPISDVPICSDHAAPEGNSEPRHQHAPFCPICQITCCAAYAVVPAPAIFAGSADMGWVSYSRYSIAEPRGPPPVTARARAPPLFSEFGAASG